MKKIIWLVFLFGHPHGCNPTMPLNEKRGNLSKYSKNQNWICDLIFLDSTCKELVQEIYPRAYLNGIMIRYEALIWMQAKRIKFH